MPIDYTNHDYESLKNRITDLYKDKPGLGEGYEGSMGQTLIQLLADVTDGLHYKLERRSQEVYSSTARLESSVWAAVSSFGYRPRRAVGATGRVLLSLLDEEGNSIASQGNIFIPYGKRMEFNGVPFMPVEDYVIREGDSSIEMDIIQGEIERTQIDFSEVDSYEIPDFRDIEEYSIQVFSDSGEWKDVFSSDNGIRIRAISFAESDDMVYDIRYTKEAMRIVFGDGVFGKRPDTLMEFSWVRTLGDEVNVVKNGREFEFDEEVLSDDLLVTPANEYYYEMVNITPISGGASHESMEEMRENVTAYIRSNDRAVTNTDYEFWVKRSGIGEISDVKAYGEHETNRLIFTMNNVYISYATSDRLPLNPPQLEQIRDYIDRVKMNTTHVVFRPVDRIYLGLEIDFQRHPSLPISSSQLYRVLVDRINNYFKVKKGSIGKGFQHSEFVEFLQNLKFEFRSIVYPMTDFVKVKVTGLVPFSVPQPAYDGIIEVYDSYEIKANDVWNVTIDSKTYTVVTSSTDSISTMVDKMMNEIFKGTRLMLAKPNFNQIRVAYPEDTGTFDISLGSGDLASVTSFKQFIRIPRPNNTFNPNVNQLLPESVKIVNGDGDELMIDDGEGTLISADGSYASISIDYSDCKFQTPSIPEETYYLSFQQNRFQNFEVTDEGIIDLMPFRSLDDSSEEHFFSVLNVK